MTRRDIDNLFHYVPNSKTLKTGDLKNINAF